MFRRWKRLFPSWPIPWHGSRLAGSIGDKKKGGGGAAVVPTDAELSPSGNAIVAKLAELDIPSRTYGHVACMTGEELVTNVPLPPNESHTKNLFFKDKKHGMFLVTVSPDAEVNTKSLGKDMLGLEGKVNLRLAGEDVLMDKLGCRKGCLGPLAIVNNLQQNDVTLVLDENLLKVGAVHSHPLRNDASTVLKPDALLEYLKKIGVEPIVVEFPKKDGEGVAVAVLPRSGPASPPLAVPSNPRRLLLPRAGRRPSRKFPKRNEKEGEKKVKDTTNKKVTKKGETLLALQWKKAGEFSHVVFRCYCFVGNDFVL